jgi:hypothetical protein
MAMSIHVHHGLIDGLQLGQFVDYFQEIMNQNRILYMFPIAFHPIYQHPPRRASFSMLKYELLPQQLLHEGTATQTDFFELDYAI